MWKLGERVDRPEWEPVEHRSTSRCSTCRDDTGPLHGGQRRDLGWRPWRRLGGHRTARRTRRRRRFDSQRVRTALDA